MLITAVEWKIQQWREAPNSTCKQNAPGEHSSVSRKKIQLGAESYREEQKQDKGGQKDQDSEMKLQHV